MGWNNSVVTQKGIGLLNESLAGYSLTIMSAAGGSGTLDVADLENAADVVERKQTFAVPSIEDFKGGKKVRIQITNRDVTEKYILHQIGAFARLSYQTEEEPDTMLFIMQDERGVEIPSWEENPDFLLEIYAVIAISNEADIQVNIDASTVVSDDYMREVIAEELVKHDESKSAHGNIWRTLENVQTALSQSGDELTEHLSDPSAHPELMSKMTEMLNAAIAQVQGGSILISEESIPADGWEKLDAADSGCLWRTDVPVENATEEHVPLLFLTRASMEPARVAGLSPTVEALEGAVRLWAEAQPGEDLACTLVLLAQSSGGGSGAFVLPVATEDTLGGVKASDSVTVDADGTAHAVAQLSADSFASDEEVSQMLDTVFEGA